jgi:hypothetical protein
MKNNKKKIQLRIQILKIADKVSKAPNYKINILHLSKEVKLMIDQIKVLLINKKGSTHFQISC